MDRRLRYRGLCIGPPRLKRAVTAQGRTAEAIAELDLQVIETAAKYHISTEQLFSETTSEEAVTSLMTQIREHLGVPLSPSHGTCAQARGFCGEPTTDHDGKQ